MKLLLNLKIFLFLAVFLLPIMVKGNENAPTNKIVATYFEHPAMSPFIAFMDSVYEELGITLDVRPFPASHGMRALNEGVVDADIMRIDELASQLDNVIVLQPAIYQGNVILLCRRGLPCSSDALMNRRNYVVTTEVVKLLLAGADIKARLRTLENIENSMDILRMGRTDYVIIGTTDTHWKIVAEEFETALLKQVSLHHIVHKKHQALVPELQRIIETKSLTFDPDAS
ncbi:MAG: hypothetical protein GJ680_01345 [Alteromonadaceae bacterium]|nr:hypothetical protein [Alteromonadaceae bacterium]